MSSRPASAWSAGRTAWSGRVARARVRTSPCCSAEDPRTAHVRHRKPWARPSAHVRRTSSGGASLCRPVKSPVRGPVSEQLVLLAMTRAWRAARTTGGVVAGGMTLPCASSSFLFLPPAGGDWTDDGEVHSLKRRAATATRPAPVPPQFVRILRAHIERFGVAPDGRLFRNQAGNYV